jgi:hypothetical protein
MLSLLPDSLMDFKFVKGYFQYINDVYEPTDQQSIPTIIFNGEKDQIDISTSNQKNENAVLYDVLGKVVGQAHIEAGNGQLGVSTLPTGTYFVKYGNYTKKIVIGGKP